MAGGAADRKRTTIGGTNLDTVGFVICLATFVAGAALLGVASIEYGILLLAFGLGGMVVFRPDDESDGERDAARSERDPLSVLRERYAHGELSDEEFERRLDRLLETESNDDVRERPDRELLTERS